MDDHRVVGVGLLVVAALLLANPLFVYQHPDEINEVRLVDGNNATTTANYTYANLSDRGKELFREVQTSQTGIVQFHGDHKRPEEFDFVKEDRAVRLEGHLYRIDRDGERYYLLTLQRPPVRNESERSQGLLLLGGLLGLLGGLYVWRPQPLRLGVVLAGGGAVLFALNVAYRFANDLFGFLTVLGSLAFVAVGILGAIITLGYLAYKTMRERREAGVF